MRLVYNLRDQDWQTTKSLGILHLSTRILGAVAELPEVEVIHVLANRSLAPHLARLPRSPSCQIHYASSPAPSKWARLLWDHWSISRACDRLAPDWLLLPKGFSPLATWPRARVSALVHDHVVGFYRRHGQKPFGAGEAALFDAMLRRTANRADAIVTNSNFTAQEFTRDFSPRRTPVRIGAPVANVAHGTNRAASGAALLLPTSAWPHKLTAHAIEWMERWTREQRYAGKVHGYGSLPANGRWPPNLRWLHHGRIGDDALAKLEAESAALIYFSAYEGYGLPPVEAAVAGRRAIASDLPALRETMPPECLFDNSDFASFDRTLRHVLATPPQPPLVVDTAHDVGRRWLDVLRNA